MMELLSRDTACIERTAIELRAGLCAFSRNFPARICLAKVKWRCRIRSAQHRAYRNREDSKR